MVDYIKLEGSPKERGLQQAEQLKEKIKFAIDHVLHSEMFAEVTSKLIPLSVIKFALSFIGKKHTKKHLEKFVPNQHEKMLAIAKGSKLGRFVYGLHFIEVMNGDPNFYRNPPKPTPPLMGCSLLFALPEATANNEMYFARNFDFPNILQPIQMIREEIPDDGYRNLNVSLYPMAGTHQGLNEKGLVIGYNYGRAWKKNPLDYRMDGVPSMFIVQEALETCATTEDAIDFFSKFPARPSGAHFGIMDKTGDACVLETTATRHTIRRPVNGILAHTNTYVSEELKDANLPLDVRFKMDDMDFSPIESPIRRLMRENHLMSKAKGKITMDTLKEILCDHVDGKTGEKGPTDFTVCTHGHSAGTLGTYIIDLRKLEIWITDNHPCETEFERFSL